MRALRKCQEVEPHSAIVLVELLLRRILLVTRPLFATPAVEQLGRQAPIAMVHRFERRAATTWVLQVSREIKRLFEMLAHARLDLHVTVGIEQYFVIVPGGRRGRRVKERSSLPLEIRFRWKAIEESG